MKESGGGKITVNASVTIPRKTFLQRLKGDIRRHWLIYMLGFLCLVYYFIFCYLPMGGIVIAFKDFRPARGIFGSKWANPWYKYFDQFFNGYYFWRLLRNTLVINLLDLLFGFPAPILLAILLNELKSTTYKRAVQTVTYLPHFISQLVVCGIILDFFSSSGVINQLLQALGMQKIMFMQEPGLFRPIYVGTGIWQEVGYGSIIYLSALSSVDMELYDAAAIDGCNRFRRVVHTTSFSTAGLDRRLSRPVFIHARRPLQALDKSGIIILRMLRLESPITII